MICSRSRLLPGDVLVDQHLGGRVGQDLGLLRIGVDGLDLEELGLWHQAGGQRAKDLARRHGDLQLLGHQVGKGAGAHEGAVGIGQRLGHVALVW